MSGEYQALGKRIGGRQRTAAEQIRRHGIRGGRVLDALLRLPRHVIVRPQHQHLADTDGALPIASDETASPPCKVALMTQALALRGDERVLEIGTGSGLQAAIRAGIAKRSSIERHEALADEALRRRRSLGYNDVAVIVAGAPTVSSADREANRWRPVGDPGRPSPGTDLHPEFSPGRGTPRTENLRNCYSVLLVSEGAWSPGDQTNEGQ